MSATALNHAAPQGWPASLELSYEPRAGRTALVRRRHSGPLSVQRPFHPDDDGTCHTYILHPPAGIVGGDELRLDIDLARDSRVLITTPGATRWYYSDGRTAALQQTASCADATRLEWLPQETLLFDGARAKSLTRIDLAGSARLLSCEIIGFGRPACDEAFTHGALDMCFELARDGALLLRERLVATGTPAGLRGHAALMTLVVTHANNDALEAAQAQCAAINDVLLGATLINDVLICRGLAAECAPLILASRALRDTLKPLAWSAPASIPRIWRT